MAFALLSSIAARGADGPPDALGRGWQFDMLDAELGERIDADFASGWYQTPTR